MYECRNAPRAEKCNNHHNLWFIRQNVPRRPCYTIPVHHPIQHCVHVISYILSLCISIQHWLTNIQKLRKRKQPFILGKPTKNFVKRLCCKVQPDRFPIGCSFSDASLSLVEPAAVTDYTVMLSRSCFYYSSVMLTFYATQICYYHVITNLLIGRASGCYWLYCYALSLLLLLFHCYAHFNTLARACYATQICYYYGVTNLLIGRASGCY